jgi:hypothetical protein
MTPALTGEEATLSLTAAIVPTHRLPSAAPRFDFR